MLDAETVVIVGQVAWLTLCGMMLFSRFIFQAQGAVEMRLFLDTWKNSTTHRVWGWVAFAAGLALGVSAVGVSSQLGWRDTLVVTSVVLILCADGLLNLFPLWFGNFKERMQSAWVRRHGASAKASDNHLFGTVNFLLGAASVIVGAVVYVHRPMPAMWLAVSLVIAFLLTLILVLACQAEGREEAK